MKLIAPLLLLGMLSGCALMTPELTSRVALPLVRHGASVCSGDADPLTPVGDRIVDACYKIKSRFTDDEE
jgi:hypothetical protein